MTTSTKDDNTVNPITEKEPESKLPSHNEKESESKLPSHNEKEPEKVDQSEAQETKLDVNLSPQSIPKDQPTSQSENDPESASDNDTDSSLHDEIDTLKQQIQDLKHQNASYKDQLLRTMAEIENVRRRAQRDREDIAKFSLSTFAGDILGITDNLTRAIEAIPKEIREKNANVDTLLIGIEAIERQLISIFDRFAIKKMEVLGQPFDPNFHQVMFEIETNDKSPGTIVQVVRSGYMIHERLLREALVGIAKAVPIRQATPDTSADASSSATDTSSTKDASSSATDTPSTKDASPSATDTPSTKDASPSTTDTPSTKDASPSTTDTPSTKDASPSTTDTSSTKDASPSTTDTSSTKDASPSTTDTSSTKDASPSATDTSSTKDASPSATDTSSTKDASSSADTSVSSVQPSTHDHNTQPTKH